jgi:hypothetical protein
LVTTLRDRDVLDGFKADGVILKLFIEKAGAEPKLQAA